MSRILYVNGGWSQGEKRRGCRGCVEAVSRPHIELCVEPTSSLTSRLDVEDVEARAQHPVIIATERTHTHHKHNSKRWVVTATTDNICPHHSTFDVHARRLDASSTPNSTPRRELDASTLTEDVARLDHTSTPRRYARRYARRELDAELDASSTPRRQGSGIYLKAG